MRSYTVYLHTTPSNKHYVGITSMPTEKRFGKNGKGYATSKYFYRAIQKYGWDNIQHTILYTGLTREQASEKEKELIALYQSNKREFGYNCTLGGDGGMLGYSPTEETRRKQSIAHKGKPVVHTPEQDRLQSERMKGTKLHLGYKASEDSRKRMSEAHKGLPLTQKQLDNLKKIHERNRGKPRSEEVRKKISQSRMGMSRGKWTETERKAHMEANERRRQAKKNTAII